MSVHQPSLAMILVVRARGEEERMPQARRNPLWLQRLDLERDSSLCSFATRFSQLAPGPSRYGKVCVDIVPSGGAPAQIIPGDSHRALNAHA
jgi:hypothetical protein